MHAFIKCALLESGMSLQGFFYFEREIVGFPVHFNRLPFVVTVGKMDHQIDMIRFYPFISVLASPKTTQPVKIIFAQCKRLSFTTVSCFGTVGRVGLLKTVSLVSLSYFLMPPGKMCPLLIFLFFDVYYYGMHITVLVIYYALCN